MDGNATIRSDREVATLLEEGDGLVDPNARGADQCRQITLRQGQGYEGAIPGGGHTVLPGEGQQLGGRSLLESTFARLSAIVGSSSTLARKVSRSISRKVVSSNVITLAERPKLSARLISPINSPRPKAARTTSVYHRARSRIPIRCPPEQRIRSRPGPRW